MRLRWLLMVLVALLIGWGGGATSAQSEIPDGVFVQDDSGWMWLILEGKRVNIPVWPAAGKDVLAIPRSDRWAVLNAGGAIGPGDPPAWLTPGGDAPLSGQRPQPHVPGVSPTDPGKPTFVEGVEGQQATAMYREQRIRATVDYMLTTHVLRSTKDATDTGYFQFDTRWPSGMFVVVVVSVENLGTQPVCCLPSFRLKDARGRFFSGDTSDGAERVRHAGFWFVGSGPSSWDRDDYQPNLPKRRTFVYDVPTDARGFVLSPPR